MAEGGFAYAVTVPAHAAVVIGMDKTKLPHIGAGEKPKKLLEITALTKERTSFDYHPSEKKKATLTFGEIRDVADVYVNKTAAGRLIFRPYELDITPYLVDGENNVEVEVTGCMTATAEAESSVGFDGCAVRVCEEID